MSAAGLCTVLVGGLLAAFVAVGVVMYVGASL